MSFGGVPSADSGTTIVCAATEMYPSMWHPKSIFTVSPAFKGSYFWEYEKIEIHEIDKY